MWLSAQKELCLSYEMTKVCDRVLNLNISQNEIAIVITQLKEMFGLIFNLLTHDLSVLWIEKVWIELKLFIQWDVCKDTV